MLDKIVLASSNDAKIAEIKAILGDIEAVPHQELFGKIDIIETGNTFKENARIKAESVSEKTDLPVIADDSGLVIPALGDFPGVKSHRFFDESGGAEGAFAELAKRLQGKDHGAYFVSSIAFARKGLPTKFATGEIHGFLTFPPRGNGGFGYDPIFVPNGSGSTLAELGEDFKTKFGHRAAALRKLASYIESLNKEDTLADADTKIANKPRARISKRARKEIDMEEFKDTMDAAEAVKENN
jgi:XTP/dITP diphosphohydrolase